MQHIYNNLLMSQYCVTMLGFLSIVLCIVEYEWTIDYGLNQNNDHRFWLLVANMLVMLTMMANMVGRYQIKVMYYRATGGLRNEDNLYTTGWWKQLLFEIVCTMVTPNPIIMDASFTIR